MNAKNLIIIAALSISAGTAFAGEYTAPFANDATTSTLTRAAVQQELYRAKAAGEIVSGEYYGTPAPAHSNLSRAVVERELRQAQAAGEVVSGELYGQLPTMVGSSFTRKQVQAEAVANVARQAHSNSTLEFIGG